MIESEFSKDKSKFELIWLGFRTSITKKRAIILYFFCLIGFFIYNYLFYIATSIIFYFVIHAHEINNYFYFRSLLLSIYVSIISTIVFALCLYTMGKLSRRVKLNLKSRFKKKSNNKE